MLNPKMKSRIIFKGLFSFILVLLMSQNVSAQKNNIKGQMIGLFTGELSYERLITPKTSLSIGFQSINYADLRISLNENKRGAGKGISIEHRNYFGSEKSLNGFYFGKSLNFSTNKLKANKRVGDITWFLFIPLSEHAKGSVDVNVISPALSLGYQRRWKWFTMEGGASLNYSIPMGGHDGIPLDNKEVVEFPKNFSGFQPNIYIGMGIAF